MKNAFWVKCSVSHTSHRRKKSLNNILTIFFHCRRYEIVQVKINWVSKKMNIPESTKNFLVSSHRSVFDFQDENNLSFFQKVIKYMVDVSKKWVISWHEIMIK